MMVAGKFEARGRGSKEIRLTLNEERNEVIGEFTNETATEYSTVVDGPPVRLVGGRTPLEGRLQVCRSQQTVSNEYFQEHELKM